ncbi:hypothetical protein MTO96_023860 [Rhipicephalus appendiculatus]
MNVLSGLPHCTRVAVRVSGQLYTHSRTRGLRLAAAASAEKRPEGHSANRPKQGAMASGLSLSFRHDDERPCRLDVPPLRSFMIQTSPTRHGDHAPHSTEGTGRTDTLYNNKARPFASFGSARNISMRLQ